MRTCSTRWRPARRGGSCTSQTRSCYGATGSRPITEDEPPSALRLGRCFTPALDRLDGYVVAGLPIVTAFPGVGLRQRLVVSRTRHRAGHGWPPCAAVRDDRARGCRPFTSTDCARALVHLAEHGEAGGRYFLVNSDPIRMHEFARTFARLANRPLRVWRVPAVATRLVVGPVLADDILADAVFSNIRLRGIGFRFRYPTLEQGLQQILGALHE